MTPGDPTGAGPGPDAEETRRALVLTQVVAGGLALTVPLYAGILWALTSGVLDEPISFGLPAAAGLALIAAGIIALVLAPGLERRLMATPAAPAPPEGSDAGPGRLEREGKSEGRSPLERYRAAKVVGFAVREAAAALGLVAGLAVGRPLWGYAVMAVAFVAMLAAWPRAADLGSRPGELPPGGGGSVEPR